MMRIAFLPALGLLSYPTALSQGVLVTTISIPYCPTPTVSGLGIGINEGNGGFGANGSSGGFGTGDGGNPSSTT